LSHTQGKKHQAGLARRAAMEAKLARQKGETDVMMPMISTTRSTRTETKVKIGRPGYEVSKSRDPETNERCLTFELHYPELDDARNRQPRHRFMSAYEQRVETPPDGNYQYLLVACLPYETVSFKIPNEKINKGEGKFVTNWDTDAKVFTLTLHFLNEQPKGN
jgi:splicing factor 3A subunit 2